MTIRDAIAEAGKLLADAGIEAARTEAWLLLGSVLSWDRATLIAHALDELNDMDRQAFFALASRRSRHEPTAQILGQKEFWSLPFTVSKEVLCPRPDSETLVEMTLALLKKRFGGESTALRLLDLGTGSGCLALALLHELPGASGIGIDRSETALAIASANGNRLGLTPRVDWLCSNWTAALDGTFDLIISNPPYISAREWPALAPEIRLFEPDIALLAGADGLDAYRLLAPEIKRLLAPGGIACLEHGYGQADDITRLMADAGLTRIAQQKDLAGIERCLAFE